MSLYVQHSGSKHEDQILQPQRAAADRDMLSMMVFSALNIQQSQGMIESHFGIFTLLAFLLY